MKRLSLIALIVPLAVGLGACSTEDVPAPEGQAPPSVKIQMFMYEPSPLTVAVGDTVTWTNTDQILHTATSGAPGSPTGVFDGTMEDAGSSFSFRFTEAGTFEYFCNRHNSMRGTVVVS